MERKNNFFIMEEKLNNDQQESLKHNILEMERVWNELKSDLIEKTN